MESAMPTVSARANRQVDVARRKNAVRSRKVAIFQTSINFFKNIQ
jgi:hypothetical protein